MTIYEMIGYVASACSTLALLPQVIHAMRTSSTRDVSFLSQLFFLTASILWIIYGVSIWKIPVIIPNVFLGIFSLSLIYLKITRP